MPIALAIALGALCGCHAAAEPQDPNRVLAWNDDCQPIWDAKWGGPQIASLLNPDFGELRKVAGQKVEEKYLDDTEKWLRAALEPQLIPHDLAGHALAMRSHVLAMGTTGRFSQLASVVEQKGLSLSTYKDEPGIDTSGVLVRYETAEWVILVADKAQRLAILARDKMAKGDFSNPEVRSHWLSEALPRLFRESIWKSYETKATLQTFEDTTESGVSTAWLAAESKKRVSKHFGFVHLTLPPGPVIKAVFHKTFFAKNNGPAEPIPHQRFEDAALFDNQNFEGPPPPTPPEGPVTNKPPDYSIPMRRGIPRTAPAPPATP